PVVLIENAVSAQDYITFNINITDVDEVGSITAIELYQGETLVKTLTDLSVREFTGLLSNNAYTIKVTYTYDLNDGVGAQTITINQAATTLAKATPTVVIDNVVPTQTSIGFGITVTDVDQVGAVSAIELYQGETLVEALTDLSVREFTGLLSNNEYTIKVTYTYDLNDGIGSQTLVVSQTATTVTKATPVVLLENVVPTQDTITFDINVTDVDEVGSITAIELYKGETLVEALTDLELRTFTNLLSNNEYQVKVTYTYDLDDGQNNQNSIEEYSFYTESKQLPKVEINDYLADNNELFIQPSIVDVDKVLVSVTYELYSEDNELIDSVVNPQESFKNIQSQTTYFLKIKINSDLNDNRGLYDEELIIQITIEYFGFGTEEKPYKIFTVDELIKTQNYFDKYFILVNDLDLSNMSWSPLSNLESHIDGQLHEIKGMKIMEMNESCAYGLFKQISTQGSIKNLIISEASINIQSMNSLTVGLLAAINMGIIEQVGVNGTINVSGTQIFGGGLVGTHGSFATNYIENSYASVDININPNSFTYLGGLTGFSGAPIRNSYSTGNIKVNNLVPADLFVGGLIGFHDTSEVLNCFSDVNLFIDKTAQYKDTRIGYFCGHTNTMHGIFNSYRITKQQLITDNNLYTATDLFIDSIDFSNISFDWLKETLLWSEENWVFNHIIEKSNKYPQLIDPMLDLTLIKIDNNCLTFTVYTSEAVMSGDLTFELYLDQTLISVLNNLNIVSIQNLLSNTKYNYIITYRFDLNDGVGEQAIIISDEVITKAKATPIVLIENVVSTQDTITFDINVTDVDEVGSITAIELYKGETLVEALTNLELRTFANLLSNNGYQIKVTYTYDLNDYVGSQTLTINQSTTTLAKATPTVVIDNVVPTQTSIGFGITVTDVDQVGAVSAIELYKGEILVETLTDLSAREFTGLLSNNEYTIKVLYTYNLNDGVGSQTLTISQTGTTVAKATPAVTIDNVVPTQSSIGFGITVTDVDQVGAVSAIELYKGETLIEALTDLSMREFTGLLSNNEYTIKVTYTYDLNDGYMDKELIIISNHRTFIEMISITDIEILNEFAPLLGEVINIELTLLNPSLQEISHVIINNVRYPISGGDKISKAYINYQPQNEVGIIEIEVSAIIYVIEQTEYTLYLAETISTNTTIFGDLDILSFELVDNQVYVLENESIILSFLISEKYNVKSIEINGNEITNFTQNLNGVISISLDAQSVGVYSFTINSITYGDEQYQTTKTINGISRKVYVVYSNIYISTFSELQNMEQGYAYTLTNDIDFDGQVWEPYDFYGVLNGNGYSIINMKLVKNTLNSSYGLFIYNYGYITRLSFPNVYYNINEQVGQSLGVVAAYNMSSGTIENIAVTGTIIVNSSSSNSNEVGGIVGYNMYGTINKVYFIGDVSGGSWWVGGIAGFNEGLVANSFSIYINPIPYPITITHFGQSINNYSISRDEEISMVTIMTKEFISGILLWDEQIWDMDNLSLLNNLLPLIRHN
ncbi:MAG: hypothetical protein WC182_05910, partial [Bacilli bacterium]